MTQGFHKALARPAIASRVLRASNRLRPITDVRGAATESSVIVHISLRAVCLYGSSGGRRGHFCCRKGRRSRNVWPSAAGSVLSRAQLLCALLRIGFTHSPGTGSQVSCGGLNNQMRQNKVPRVLQEEDGIEHVLQMAIGTATADYCKAARDKVTEGSRESPRSSM